MTGPSGHVVFLPTTGRLNTRLTTGAHEAITVLAEREALRVCFCQLQRDVLGKLSESAIAHRRKLTDCELLVRQSRLGLKVIAVRAFGRGRRKHICIGLRGIRHRLRCICILPVDRDGFCTGLCTPSNSLEDPGDRFKAKACTIFRRILPVDGRSQPLDKFLV